MIGSNWDGLCSLAILVLGGVSEIEIQCICLYHDCSCIYHDLSNIYIYILVHMSYHSLSKKYLVVIVIILTSGLIRIPNVCYTLPAAIMFQVTLVDRVWNCLVYISQMHRMHGIFAYIKDEKWPHEHAKNGLCKTKTRHMDV